MLLRSRRETGGASYCVCARFCGVESASAGCGAMLAPSLTWRRVMSDISIQCPRCETRYSVSSGLVGRKFLCQCKNSFEISLTQSSSPIPSAHTPRISDQAQKVLDQRANERAIRNRLLTIIAITGLVLFGAAAILVVLVNLVLWRSATSQANNVLIEGQEIKLRREADDKLRADQELRADEARKAEELRLRAKDEDRIRKAHEAVVERLKQIQTSKLKALTAAAPSIRALKSLQARLEVGMTKAEFSTALGDTWVVVRAFLETPEKNLWPELTRDVSEPMKSYAEAQDVWADAIKYSMDLPYLAEHGQTYRSKLQSLIHQASDNIAKLNATVSTIRN